MRSNRTSCGWSIGKSTLLRCFNRMNDTIPGCRIEGSIELDGERIRVSEVDALGKASVSAGNMGTLARSERWAAWGEIVSRVDRIRGYGDFYHYHLLASGRIDAVVESDVNILDIAALSLIVQEAGGVFTDLEGAPVGLATTSVLAGNTHLHPALLQALR